LAVLFLLAIKSYSISKSYHHQLSTFIPPSTLLPDIKSKLKNTDPRPILNQNLAALHHNTSKMRNVAILVALLKETGNLSPFVEPIKSALKQIDYGK
jgi:hypothetical protein